jgi:hypothetical protein
MSCPTEEAGSELEACDPSVMSCPTEEAGSELETSADNLTNNSQIVLEKLKEINRKYGNLDWKANDFPGGNIGPNEGDAKQLAKDLKVLLPERRVNLGKASILTLDEVKSNPDILMYVTEETSRIPGDVMNRKLNHYALENFTRMVEHASSDGIILELGGPRSAFRTVQQSEAINTNIQNCAAAACGLSAHNLGLAIDVKLPPYLITTNQNFKNIVEMRNTPTYSWLFLHGKDYGWFPYHNEPWHWEYNPPGFRSNFYKECNCDPR